MFEELSSRPGARLLPLAVALAALAVAGRIERWQVALAVKLLPALLAGLVVSRLVAPLLDARWLRPAVLSFAAASGVVAMARGFAG